MFGLSKEEKLQKYLNNRMPGHNVRVSGNLSGRFRVECKALPSQMMSINFALEQWLADNGYRADLPRFSP